MKTSNTYYEFHEEEEKRKSNSWLNAIFLFMLLAFAFLMGYIFYVKNEISAANVTTDIEKIVPYIENAVGSVEGYKYFRWSPTKLRSCQSTGCGCWMELAELKFYDQNDDLITWDKISEGAGGCRHNNAVAKAFDGSVNGDMYASGRWAPLDSCTSQPRGCVFAGMEKNNAVEISKYEWIAGSNRNGDPLSWKLEGRRNEISPWVILHTVNDYKGTITSKGRVGPFHINLDS
jgi:hypothetical protein